MGTVRKGSFVFGVLLLVLAFTCGAGTAGEGSGGDEKSFVPFGNTQRVTANNAYVQEFLVEDDAAGCALSGPRFDRYGVYYFVRRNAAGTESYIFKNY
jgi:hypothetical protein